MEWPCAAFSPRRQSKARLPSELKPGGHAGRGCFISGGLTVVHLAEEVGATPRGSSVEDGPFADVFSGTGTGSFETGPRRPKLLSESASCLDTPLTIATAVPAQLSDLARFVGRPAPAKAARRSFDVNVRAKPAVAPR